MFAYHPHYISMVPQFMHSLGLLYLIVIYSILHRYFTSYLAVSAWVFFVIFFFYLFFRVSWFISVLVPLIPVFTVDFSIAGLVLNAFVFDLFSQRVTAP